jgi:beta-mannosidase
MMSLNGVWRLWAFPANAEKRSIDEITQAPAMPAAVPGNVEFALQDAGLLPDDLFMGDNILKCQEFETYDYLYERRFTLTADALAKPQRLVFEGVDCIADYYLNGILLGHTENALIAHTFPCGELLREDNILQVYLRSPLVWAADQEYYPFPLRETYYHNQEQLRLRKPASCFGWDIMPRTVSAGLWRGVRIEEIPATELTDVYIAPIRVSEAEATLQVNFTSRTAPQNIRRLSLKIEGRCGKQVFSQESKVYFTAGFVGVKIPQPKLWMPRGYGEQNLYDVTVTLLVDGVPAASVEKRVGIRTVRLERVPREKGFREFRFYVNDTPIFCKGSNWVPMDAFHSRDPLRYKRAVGMLADLGCNIVRCWGGNVYEDHAFFDLCDEYGIMVWQDFEMACGPYPEDDAFLKVMETEATAVIRKLRGHASLLLWCGDNECDYYDPDPKSNKLTRGLLPEVVRREDPHRPYLASSPDLGERADGDTSYNGVSAEQHIWGARDHYKARFYSAHNARFVSETGYHGCNSPESIAKFITPGAIWPWENNHEWHIHAADAGRHWYDSRIPMMAKQTRQILGYIPDNLPDFSFISQFAQAEAKKFFIETMRLRKWEGTGVIWWNLTDGWPQFSDAIVDYYFEKKLAYGWIKRAQQGCVLCMGEIESWRAPLTVCNDTLADIAGTYRVYDAETDETLAEGAFTAAANENSKLPGVELFYSEKRLLILALRYDGKTVYNHYITGEVPYTLEQTRRWAELLEKLPE